MTSTWPLGSDVALWPPRAVVMGAATLQVPEAGSYTSADEVGVGAVTSPLVVGLDEFCGARRHVGRGHRDVHRGDVSGGNGLCRGAKQLGRARGVLLLRGGRATLPPPVAHEGFEAAGSEPAGLFSAYAPAPIWASRGAPFSSLSEALSQARKTSAPHGLKTRTSRLPGEVGSTPCRAFSTALRSPKPCHSAFSLVWRFCWA